MKILLADKLAKHVEENLLSQGHEVTSEPTARDELLTELLRQSQAEILVVRSTKLRSEQIRASSSLALIIRAGAGINTIDIQAASERGVFVANCPGRNAIAVAELTIGHLINADRRIADNARDFRNGVWAKKAYAKADGLLGKRMALIGVGACGAAVIERLQPFGINLVAWSRSLTPAKAAELGVEFAATPEQALRDANAVSIHLAATPQTHHFLNAERLALLADGAYVINTSRGELIDETALLAALDSKKLVAGLDVFHNEPGSNAHTVNSPLCEHPRVYGTHHIGASTNQATLSVGDAVLEIINKWYAHGQVLNCVNLARQSPADHTLTVRHADRVGVLASVLDELQAAGHNVQEMDNIIFQGGLAACARIQVVNAPSQELITSIKQLSDVYAVSVSVH